MGPVGNAACLSTPRKSCPSPKRAAGNELGCAGPSGPSDGTGRIDNGALHGKSRPCKSGASSSSRIRAVRSLEPVNHPPGVPAETGSQAEVTTAPPSASTHRGVLPVLSKSRSNCRGEYEQLGYKLPGWPRARVALPSSHTNPMSIQELLLGKP